MQFSIPIPVHETPKRLYKKCLESVCNQLTEYSNKFMDYEVVVMIDSHSRQNKQLLYLTNQFRNNHPEIIWQVHVLEHAENVSVVRNALLSKVRGDWTIWVDSDDTIVPTMLWQIHKRIMQNGNSIDGYVSKFNLLGDTSLFDANDTWIDNYATEGPYSSFCEEFSHKWLRIIPTCNCSLCYNTEYLKKLRIRFDESLSRYEDFNYNMQILCHEPRLYKIPLALYNYYKRSGSLSTAQIGTNMHEFLRVRKLTAEIIAKTNPNCRFTSEEIIDT